MYTDDFEIRYDDEEIVEEDCLPECEESEEEENPEIGEDQEENEGGCDGEGIYEDILPYPPIENIQPNKLYAAIVKNLYSGMVSEMTASTQYFYNSCVLRNCYEEAYEAFKRIMIVEMHHMEMLSRVCQWGTTKRTHRMRRPQMPPTLMTMGTRASPAPRRALARTSMKVRMK